MTEWVWVLPEAALDFVVGLRVSSNPVFKGFAHKDGAIRAFWDMLDSAVFMERSAAEVDASFKQIIPYVLVSSGGKFLVYERSGGKEARLDRKFSMGVGGHVNPVDKNSNWRRTAFFAVLREIDEELCTMNMGCRFPASVVLYDRLAIKGIIYDDADSVGRVHVGMVLHADIDPGAAKDLHVISEGKNLAWMTPGELHDLGDRLEGWSRKSLAAIEAGAPGYPVTLRDLSEE